MKFNPLILLGGTVGIVVLVAVVGRIIYVSGGDAEAAIPAIAGLVAMIAFGAFAIKWLFFRQR